MIKTFPQLYMYFVQSTVEYTLAAKRKHCVGSEVKMGYQYSLEDCAKACFNVSSMFIYGTNDFNYYPPRCSVAQDGCLCYCQISASEEGSCDTKAHMGYKLYRYANKGWFMIVI